MTIELWLTGRDEPATFQMDVEFTPGNYYWANDPLAQYYQLRLYLTILDRVYMDDESREGWENGFKIRCLNTDALSISRVVTNGWRKVTVVKPLPGYEEGEVFESEISDDIKMPAHGEIIRDVRGKADYLELTYDFWPENASPMLVRVEYEITKIKIYAENIVYLLSFDLNGGDGGYGLREFGFAPGGVVDYTLCAFQLPTRSGYSFLGWSENSTDTTPQYPLKYEQRFENAPNGTVFFPGEKSFKMPNHDCVLYAIWHKWTYLPLTQNGVILRPRTSYPYVPFRDGGG